MFFTSDDMAGGECAPKAITFATKKPTKELPVNNDFFV